MREGVAAAHGGEARPATGSFAGRFRDKETEKVSQEGVWRWDGGGRTGRGKVSRLSVPSPGCARFPARVLVGLFWLREGWGGWVQAGSSRWQKFGRLNACAADGLLRPGGRRYIDRAGREKDGFAGFVFGGLLGFAFRVSFWNQRVAGFVSHIRLSHGAEVVERALVHHVEASLVAVEQMDLRARGQAGKGGGHTGDLGGGGLVRHGAVEHLRLHGPDAAETPGAGSELFDHGELDAISGLEALDQHIEHGLEVMTALLPTRTEAARRPCRMALRKSWPCPGE